MKSCYSRYRKRDTDFHYIAHTPRIHTAVTILLPACSPRNSWICFLGTYRACLLIHGCELRGSSFCSLACHYWSHSFLIVQHGGRGEECWAWAHGTVQRMVFQSHIPVHTSRDQRYRCTTHLCHRLCRENIRYGQRWYFCQWHYTFFYGDSFHYGKTSYVSVCSEDSRQDRGEGT